MPSAQLDMSTQARAGRALDVPLLDFLNAAPLDERDLTQGIFVELSAPALNAVGGVHAGALATMLEVTAYLAIVRELKPEEEAITHDFFASYIARIPPDARLEARGTVVRRGGRVAFVSAEARADGSVVATASVT